MIKATLKTMNGKEVKLEIPQSASEIPLKRFIRARIAYYEIDALFGEKTFGTEYRFLQKVIEFIAFVLSVDANELMGFKTGSIKSNAETLAFGVTQTQKWKSIDTTIYQLYSYLAAVFRQAGAKEHKGDLHFKYKGDKYFIPKFIRTGLQSGNVVPIDLFGWQGIELAEVQRQVEAYADTLTSKNEYGSEVDLLSLTEEQQDKYADIQYNGYLNALAIMTRKEGDNISELAMKGQHHVDEFIQQRSKHFSDIDTQTAVDCFFFGLNIGSWLAHQAAMNIYLARQSRLQYLKEKKRQKQ